MVIAIIAILAAILFPVFARARENARKSNCQSNEKQIMTAVLAYTQDYDERLITPRAGRCAQNGSACGNGTYQTWRYALQPYVKNSGVFVCPSAFATRNESNATVKDVESSYGLNARLCGCCGARIWAKVANIEQPTEYVIVGESLWADCNIWCHPNGGSNCFMTPHMRGANYGFLDGHVKWYLPERTVDPVFLWLPENPADMNGSRSGAWGQARQVEARDRLAIYRQKVPN